MKHTTAPGQTPGTAQSVEPTGETTKNRLLRRLKLALIQDELGVIKDERADQGYNPYDAASARPRDVWRSKPKRA